MSHSHNDGLSEPRRKAGGDTFGAWLPIVCGDRLLMERKVAVGCVWGCVEDKKKC